jgi:hypothetical protein
MQHMQIAPLAVVVAALAGLAYYFLVYRPETRAQRQLVTLDQIPRVLELLTTGAGDGSFAEFVFPPTPDSRAEQDRLSLGFSIEGGRAGLDWSLSAPANVAARDRVRAFLESQGYAVQQREMNGVTYLRAEGENLALLGQRLLVDLFRVRRTQEMELLTEGFEWPA